MSDDYIPKLGKYGDKKNAINRTDAILENGRVRNNSDYKSDSLWARLGFTPNKDNEYYINLNHLKSERGMPPDINFITVDTDYSKFSRSENYEKTGIDLSAKHNISESFVLKEKLFYHTHKDEFLSYDDPTYKNLDDIQLEQVMIILKLLKQQKWQPSQVLILSTLWQA